MSVFVDDIKMTPNKKKKYLLNTSCHLYADSVGELLRFSASIGLKESWLQDGIVPHFILNAEKREKAIQKGAIEESGQHLSTKIRENRNAKRNKNSLVC